MMDVSSWVQNKQQKKNNHMKYESNTDNNRLSYVWIRMHGSMPRVCPAEWRTASTCLWSDGAHRCNTDQNVYDSNNLMLLEHCMIAAFD